MTHTESKSTLKEAFIVVSSSSVISPKFLKTTHVLLYFITYCKSNILQLALK